MAHAHGCPGCAQVGCAFKDAYIGAEAQRARGVLHLTSPIERGVVTDWPDMERILWVVAKPALLPWAPLPSQ